MTATPVRVTEPIMDGGPLVDPPIYLAKLCPEEKSRLFRAWLREAVQCMTLLDFGGLVACGTNRQKAEAVLLDVLCNDAEEGA